MLRFVWHFKVNNLNKNSALKSSHVKSDHPSIATWLRACTDSLQYTQRIQHTYSIQYTYIYIQYMYNIQHTYIHNICTVPNICTVHNIHRVHNIHVRTVFNICTYVRTYVKIPMYIVVMVPLGCSFLMQEIQFSLSPSLCSRNTYCWGGRGYGSARTITLIIHYF